MLAVLLRLPLLQLLWLASSTAPLMLPCVLAADYQAPPRVHHHRPVQTFAFGSCHKNQYVVDEPDSAALWRTITERHKPEAFLWTGDTVYAPKRGVATIDELALEYNVTSKLLVEAGLRDADTTATATAAPKGSTNEKDDNETSSLLLPMYGTWDDHDYGGNDMGKTMSQKDERRQLLLDFLDYSHWFPKDRRGMYHSVDFGIPPHQTKVIFLDTRWHRDDYRCVPTYLSTDIPLGAGLACIGRWLLAGLGLSVVCGPSQSSTILGEEQWAWLGNEIKTSNAQLHVVVSSIQVLTTNPVVESWGHFEHEQQRLLNVLQTSREKSPVSTVLLSGDVHHAEIISPRNKHAKASSSSSSSSSSGESLFEVTSSGLTHSCTKPFYGGLCGPLLRTFSTHRSPMDAYYIGRNYGTLEIDWDQGLYRVLVWSLENVAVNRDEANADETQTYQNTEQQQQQQQQQPVLQTEWTPIWGPDSQEQHIEWTTLPKVVDGHLIPHVRKLCIVILILLLMISQIYIWFILVPNSVRQHKRTRRNILEYDCDGEDDNDNYETDTTAGARGISSDKSGGDRGNLNGEERHGNRIGTVPIKPKTE